MAIAPQDHSFSPPVASIIVGVSCYAAYQYPAAALIVGAASASLSLYRHFYKNRPLIPPSTIPAIATIVVGVSSYAVYQYPAATLIVGIASASLWLYKHFYENQHIIPPPPPQPPPVAPAIRFMGKPLITFDYRIPNDSTKAASQRWLQEKATADRQKQKDLRIRVYEDTLYAINNGWVHSDGNHPPHQVNLDPTITQQMVQQTRLYELLPSSTTAGSIPQITLCNEDMIDLAITCKMQGENPALLNMADGKHAGGLVEEGSSAQEEQICRRSNLLVLLRNPQLVDANNNYLQPLPEFGGLYTPHVQFFRYGEKYGYKFIDGQTIPVQNLAVISAAAYNQAEWSHMSEDQYKERTKEKIRQILRIAIGHGHDSIILGAFGCGAFRQNPTKVAQCFADVLREPEFQRSGTGSLKKIYFSIVNDSRGSTNFQAFKSVFDNTFPKQPVQRNNP